MNTLLITERQAQSLRDRFKPWRKGWVEGQVTSPELLARATKAMRVQGSPLEAAIALVRGLAATSQRQPEPTWTLAEALVKVITTRRLAGESPAVPDDIEMMICQSDAALHALREAARGGAPIEQRDRLYSPLQPGETNPWVLRQTDAPLGDGQSKQYRLAAR